MKIKPPTKLEESGARAQTAQVGQRVDGTRNVVYVVLWTLYKRHPPPTPLPTTSDTNKTELYWANSQYAYSLSSVILRD